MIPIDLKDKIAFFAAEKIPHKYLPDPVLIKLDNYLEKRVFELRHQTIKQTWNIANLKKQLKYLHNQNDLEREV